MIEEWSEAGLDGNGLGLSEEDLRLVKMPEEDLEKVAERASLKSEETDKEEDERANPQKENIEKIKKTQGGLRDGFTRIANNILEALMYVNLTKREYKICLCVLRYGYGYRQEQSTIQNNQETIAKLTGLNKVVIGEALHSLKDKNIILKKVNKTLTFHQGKKRAEILIFNRHFETWKVNNLLTFESLKVNKTLTKRLTKHKPLGKQNINLSLPKSAPDKPFRATKESIKESKINNKSRRVDKNLNSTIERIFTSWKETMNHPKALLTSDRKQKIRARLKESYSEEDCIRAIKGCKVSKYHMGENDSGKVYDQIGLIFRNGEKLESFWQCLEKKEEIHYENE